ncbi:hypothetical protein AB0J28_19310 [Streptosporangium canum]|uniref:hypothetical protein n=1 Tax=Streptosporangium canum TaxID=324952 RepID=UPI00341B796C
MSDELRIVIQGSAELVDTTQKALVEVIAKYGADVLDEADRTAVVDHEGTGEAVITPGHIREADRVKRRAHRLRPQLTTKQKICALIVVVAAFIGGLCTNNVDKTWGQIGFMLCGLTLLAATAVGWSG